MNSPAPDLVGVLKAREEASVTKRYERGHAIGHQIGITDPDTVNDYARYYVHGQNARRAFTYLGLIATVILAFTIFPLAFVTLVVTIYLMTPYAHAAFARQAARSQQAQHSINGAPLINVCNCDTPEEA